MPEQGIIYLLHLDGPLHHARHYLGWTRDLEARLAEHTSGNGSPLVRAAIAAGATIRLAATIEGTRDDERAIKRCKDAPSRCPICQPTETERRPFHVPRRAA